jgi:hypothetical protein
MKKLFILFYSLILGAGSFALDSKNFNEKLLRSFKETFPKAEQVIWTELPGTYIVSFVENGIRSRIVYDKTGDFISSTRTYTAEDLPYYILISITKKYPEKRIFGVTEIASSSTVEYYIKMEDSKVWATFKVDSSGNLELVEKYKKQAN